MAKSYFELRENMEVGTKKTTDEYKKMTPGEDVIDPADKGEYDREGDMAKTQLRGILADAGHMIEMFSDDQNLPEWVQNKITKAADYLNSAHRYMMNKDESVKEEVELDEKFSWNDVNDALTKANYMRGKPSEIERVASKFRYKSGKDKNFSLADVKKNLSAAGIDGANQHNVMKHMKEAVELDEKFSPKEIKMAIGVASDKRYAKGNMTGAVKAIEKIAKGLSNHKQVAAVLKRQNEARKYRPPTQAEIDADKKKDRRARGQSGNTGVYTRSKQYKNMMGGLKEEDLQELDAKTQKKFSVGAKNMKTYAQKNGGVDKKDFMKVAELLDQISRVNLLQAGQILTRLNRLVDGLDTDVRERIYIELKKVGLVE